MAGAMVLLGSIFLELVPYTFGTGWQLGLCERFAVLVKGNRTTEKKSLVYARELVTKFLTRRLSHRRFHVKNADNA